MTGLVVWLLGAAVTASLVACFVLIAQGGRALIVRSGSMTGTIETGDIALTKTVTPVEVSVGDIVTFKDPSRNGELVTHRVTRMKRDGDTFAFITKGDANTGREMWSINARGKLGKYVSRIPRAGYALAWIASPQIRVGLLIGGLALIALAALRRIWR